MHIAARGSLQQETQWRSSDMAIAILFAFLALLFLGAISGVTYVAVAGGAAAGAGVVALAVFALLFPFLFVLFVFGLVRAGLCPARMRGYRHDGRPRMSDEWHRTTQESGAAGKGAS
jgi:hypothetical protein